MTLRNRLKTARSTGDPDVVARARTALLALVDTMANRKDPLPAIVDQLASGAAAQAIGHVGLQPLAPQGLACAEGCAFCCILNGADGGTITEAEARALHRALAPLAGAPDGRDWHPQACPALDPESRTCRAYEARPMICRSYVSTDAGACEEVAEGRAAPGPGTLGPYHTYLAALGLSRAALKGTRRVATYALARVAASAVAGKSCEESLNAARHKPAELDAELRRSKRDLARTTPAGLP